VTTFPRLTDEPAPKRGAVIRMAIFYSLCALVSAGLALLALYKIVSGESGFIVMLCIFGLLFVLTGYWARHYLRDLSADPIVIEGEVMKKWHKGNLFIFFMPSFYVLVAGKIFTIPRTDYAMLLENDLVRIHCFPHSLSVQSLERYDELDKKFIPASSGAYSG
jgi:hypothetical protein